MGKIKADKKSRKGLADEMLDGDTKGVKKTYVESASRKGKERKDEDEEVGHPTLNELIKCDYAR